MVDGGWGIYRSSYDLPEHDAWPMELHTDFPLPTPKTEEEEDFFFFFFFDVHTLRIWPFKSLYFIIDI